MTRSFRLDAMALLTGVAAVSCAPAPFYPSNLPHAAVRSTGTSTVSAAPLLRRFDDGSLSFNYPATWSQETSSSFGSPSHGVLVLLSSQRLVPDCRPIAPDGFDCAPAMAIDAKLSPGSIFVVWVAQWWGSDGLAAAAGQDGSVAGHPARLDHDLALFECRGLGADQTLKASVVRDDRTTGYIMTACWRSPAGDTSTQQIDALLDSTRIAG